MLFDVRRQVGQRGRDPGLVLRVIDAGWHIRGSDGHLGPVARGSEALGHRHGSCEQRVIRLEYRPLHHALRRNQIGESDIDDICCS